MTWQDPRTPASVTQVGKYTVTIFDQEKYDESLRLYGDSPTVSGKSPKFGDSNYDTVGFSSNTKPSFTKQKPAARWNWTHKLDQPLWEQEWQTQTQNTGQEPVEPVVQDGSPHWCGEPSCKNNEKMQDVRHGVHDQDLVRNFVEAREKEGHLFFWNDAAGFMHFPPTYGDTSCDTFIKKHKLAFDTFLQERKVKV